MPKRYQFTEAEAAEIRAARKNNKDKKVENRLRALEMRAEGRKHREISEATGFHAQYITMLVARYRTDGIEGIAGNHYRGNHRNLSYEEEAKLLEPFRLEAEEGKMVEVSAIEMAYRDSVGHSIGTSQIYYVLHRHGWRKVMPRSKHSKKASQEAIEASKKLKQNSQK